MYTFFEWPEMAFSPEAVGKDEQRRRAGLRRERSMFPLFMACLRHNRENNREWRKMKMCVLLLPDERVARPSMGAHPPPLTWPAVFSLFDN